MMQVQVVTQYLRMSRGEQPGIQLTRWLRTN